MVTRRAVLGGLLATASLPAWAEPIDRSPRPMPRPARAVSVATKTPLSDDDVTQLIAAAKLGGEVAFVLADAQTGQVLAARNPDLALPPASVAKAVTALYALDRLGPGFRFATRVLATGPVVRGRIQGDLVLAGGGDPTLQTDQLGDLVAALARTGVKGVTGRFLFWDGALPRQAQITDDQPVQVGYNAAVSGLNLNFNRVHFAWKRANGTWQTAVDARGERFLPPVDGIRVTIADRQGPHFSYRAGRVEEWSVATKALTNKGGSRWLPVRDPGPYAAEVLRTLARAQGISLPLPERAQSLPSGAELARVESEALPALLRDMLRFSTNITAESVGMTASGRAGTRQSAQAMSDWVRQTFKASCDLHDHSGLGGASRVTATAMAQILVQAQREKRGLKPILRDIGMRDEQGEVVKNHPVKVVAKSGTLNFVSGLAGHISPPSGRELVFAIFSGDTARRDAVPVALREQAEGASAWTKRARRLQGQLITRWAQAYG